MTPFAPNSVPIDEATEAVGDATRVGMTRRDFFRNSGMLVVGIIYHGLFMLGLREERANLKSIGLIYGRSKFPPSLVLIVALLLLIVGVVAAVSMVLHAGPYG